MQRGYDALHNPVGLAIVVSALLFTIAVVAWGGAVFKRKIAAEKEMRKALRDRINTPKN